MLVQKFLSNLGLKLIKSQRVIPAVLLKLGLKFVKSQGVRKSRSFIKFGPLFKKRKLRGVSPVLLLELGIKIEKITRGMPSRLIKFGPELKRSQLKGYVQQFSFIKFGPKMKKTQEVNQAALFHLCLKLKNKSQGVR